VQGSVASQAGARSRLLPAAVHAPVAATMARCCSPTSSPAPARSRPPGPARRRPGRSRSCCAARAWTRSGRSPPGWPASRELVDHIRALPCDTAVLDGETLALDDEGRPRAFQGTMSRFGSDAPDAGVPLSPFLFDLLHLDGRDLLDEPLHVRLDALAHLLAADEHAALRMPGVHRPVPGQAADVLDDALAAGPEGVVVKALDAAYAAGRPGMAYQKVVAEGRGRASPRPRRDRRGLGARPPHGAAVEHPSGRPRRRRAGDGGHDLQGDDRPAAGLADADLSRARPRARRLGGSTCDRNSSSRSRSTARSAVPATRAASHCGSPACCGTGRTRPRPRPTPSRRVRALLAGAADQTGGVPGPGAVPSSVPLTP
jgi:hypothetical protein